LDEEEERILRELRELQDGGIEGLQEGKAEE